MVVEFVEACARFIFLGEEKTISVTTFRKSGDGVATPTGVVPLPDGRIGFWTSSKSVRPSGREIISKFFNTLGHIDNGPFPYGDTGVIISVDA